jgi:hypothetical protein
MMKTTIMTLALALLLLTSISFGQQDTTWQKWSWLTGDWVGQGSGTPGQGGGWFSLKPDLGGKILVRRNHSEYPAKEYKPEIVHDDLMIVYLDNSGQPGRAIYFDNEGHIINYAIAYRGKSIAFTSDKVQNMPLFRLTYASLENDTINVRFEMSKDGETFLTYTEGKCTRKK